MEQGKIQRFAAVKGRHNKTMAEAGETFKRWEDLNNGDFKVGLNAMIEQNMKDQGLEWPPRVDVHRHERPPEPVYDYLCNLCGEKFTGMWTSHQCKAPPDGRKLGLMGWAWISMLVGSGSVLLFALIAAFQH